MVALPNIAEFLLKEGKFVQQVFAVYQSNDAESTPDDAEDNGISPVKKTKEDRKQKEATSVKNELKKKTLAGKKLKTKTAGKLKTKDKTFKSKQKAKVRTMKKQPKAKLTQALETDVKLVKPIELEKPVFNSEDKMVFTKFDFSSLGSEKENSKKSETPKKLLKRISDQKEKVHKLEADDKMDQAKLLKEKSTWQTALKKIRGVKVKDDPELLRKTIRRDQQMKKQSEKKWKDRQRKVKQDISDQQKTRNDNIAKKKDQRKQFVKKKAIKRGRIVPGF